MRKRDKDWMRSIDPGGADYRIFEGEFRLSHNSLMNRLQKVNSYEKRVFNLQKKLDRYDSPNGYSLSPNPATRHSNLPNKGPRTLSSADVFFNQEEAPFVSKYRDDSDSANDGGAPYEKNPKMHPFYGSKEKVKQPKVNFRSRRNSLIKSLEESSDDSLVDDFQEDEEENESEESQRDENFDSNKNILQKVLMLYTKLITDKNLQDDFILDYNTKLEEDPSLYPDVFKVKKRSTFLSLVLSLYKTLEKLSLGNDNCKKCVCKQQSPVDLKKLYELENDKVDLEKIIGDLKEKLRKKSSLIIELSLERQNFAGWTKNIIKMMTRVFQLMMSSPSVDQQMAQDLERQANKMGKLSSFFYEFSHKSNEIFEDVSRLIDFKQQNRRIANIIRGDLQEAQQFQVVIDRLKRGLNEINKTGEREKSIKKDEYENKIKIISEELRQVKLEKKSKEKKIERVMETCDQLEAKIDQDATEIKNLRQQMAQSEIKHNMVLDSRNSDIQRTRDDQISRIQNLIGNGIKESDRMRYPVLCQVLDSIVEQYSGDDPNKKLYLESEANQTEALIHSLDQILDLKQKIKTAALENPSMNSILDSVIDSDTVKNEIKRQEEHMMKLTGFFKNNSEKLGRYLHKRQIEDPKSVDRAKRKLEVELETAKSTIETLNLKIESLELHQEMTKGHIERSKHGRSSVKNRSNRMISRQSLSPYLKKRSSVRYHSTNELPHFPEAQKTPPKNHKQKDEHYISMIAVQAIMIEQQLRILQEEPVPKDDQIYIEEEEEEEHTYQAQESYPESERSGEESVTPVLNEEEELELSDSNYSYDDICPESKNMDINEVKIEDLSNFTGDQSSESQPLSIFIAPSKPLLRKKKQQVQLQKSYYHSTILAV